MSGKVQHLNLVSNAVGLYVDGVASFFHQLLTFRRQLIDQYDMRPVDQSMNSIATGQIGRRDTLVKVSS